MFFDELSDLFERVSTHANLTITGDFNLHLDGATDALTDKFLRLLAAYNLCPHVSESTHQHGHTLDLVITRDEQKVESISVDTQKVAYKQGGQWDMSPRFQAEGSHAKVPQLFLTHNDAIADFTSQSLGLPA